ncbi:MAG: carotenoid 1,2-hydratase, partial [Hyphococcus sp.]
RPDIRWSGLGYLDMNEGAAPLEKAFRYWDWSRADLGGGEAAILYNTDLWSGATRTLALKFARGGKCESFAPPAPALLPPTPVWRIQRRTRAETPIDARVVKTFEDTPFYSRSLIESRLFGEPRQSMHESFSGARFRSPIVKAMLPFRMPRRTR